jgi:hypothetical protein
MAAKSEPRTKLNNFYHKKQGRNELRMLNDMYKNSSEAEPVNLEIDFGAGVEENVAQILEGPKKSAMSEVSYVDQKSNGSIDEMTVDMPSQNMYQRKPNVTPLEVIEDVSAAEE